MTQPTKNQQVKEIIYSTESTEFDLRSVIDTLWRTDKILYDVKRTGKDKYRHQRYLVRYTEDK
jgi:hypothetical protein